MNLNNDSRNDLNRKTKTLNVSFMILPLTSSYLYIKKTKMQKFCLLR